METPEHILADARRRSSAAILELNEAHFNSDLMKKVLGEVIPEICGLLEKISLLLGSDPSNRQKVEELDSILKEFADIGATPPKLKTEFTNPFDRVVRFRI